jgi:hypothetical protein
VVGRTGPAYTDVHPSHIICSSSHRKNQGRIRLSVNSSSGTSFQGAASKLPAGIPVVILHAATRAHVPLADRAGCDAAIDRVGETRHLFHLSLEGSREASARTEERS